MPLKFLGIPWNVHATLLIIWNVLDHSLTTKIPWKLLKNLRNDPVIPVTPLQSLGMPQKPLGILWNTFEALCNSWRALEYSWNHSKLKKVPDRGTPLKLVEMNQKSLENPWNTPETPLNPPVTSAGNVIANCQNSITSSIHHLTFLHRPWM